MASSGFDYEQAFSRNLGLLTPADQARLKRATIGIPGLGGVGGSHLLTLVRMGVGRFAIADADRFELANMNRQRGATIQTLDRPKTDVLADMARSVNPLLELRLFPDGIHERNLDEFLKGCDAVVDSLDFFQIGIRRLLFRRAQALKIPVVTCGPMGFGAAMLLFMPEGPSFDEFFAIDDGMDELEQLARFAVGLAPAALHFPYIDRASVDFARHRGPSSAAAVELCAGIASVELLNLLLGRRTPWAVPRYAQFDPYRLRYRKGILWGGNRHPWQLLKLWYLKRTMLNKTVGR